MRHRDLETVNQWFKETEERLSQRILDSETRLRESMALAGPDQTIALDYPVDPRPRYGYGTPPNPHLYEIIDAARDRYAATLRGFLAYRDDLAAIAGTIDEPVGNEATWVNNWLPGLDAVALYCFVRSTQPARYLEIGSGVSTTFARRAVRDGALPTEIVSIDPHPREEIDAICDGVVRAPLEDADLSAFETLDAGDIVFFDGSHRSFTNSDVTVFFLEVLPVLAPGVLVQIHDIRLPDDYPEGWSARFYNEQYLLAAALLAGGSRLEIELPNAFVTGDAELGGILGELWALPGFEGVQTHGESFWLRIR